MNIPHAAALNKTKVGTCPHGLPQGACPVCNGMGGGGGGASVAKNKPEREMSWSECYAVWQHMLQAKADAKQAQNLAMQAHMISQYKLQLSLGGAAQKLAGITGKMAEFIQQTKSNSLAGNSSLGSKILAFSAKLAMPVLNSIKNVLSFADKAMNAIKGKIIDISDKLNAIFGEMKNAIEKKISDKLKDFKKKFKSLFGIVDIDETEEMDDEEKQIEETKRLFEMKTVLESIKEKFTHKKIKEDENGSSSYTNE